MNKIKILDNRKIGDSAAIINFKRNFEFKAGQIIEITTHAGIRPRMYSILSSETDEYIEILYKIVPTGKLTPELHLLKRGDNILISEPSGKFISNTGPAWYIATGTGIAPFISMIRSGNIADKRLIHGSRNPLDFYFSDQLKKVLAENYTPCCTGKSENTNFYGRVTDYLNSLAVLPQNNKYYLCGSAEMVVDTRDLLIKKGIQIQKILSEIYF
jgi:ferredoxin--NADP+ reductase